MSEVFISEDMLKRAEDRIKELSRIYSSAPTIFAEKRRETLAAILRALPIMLTDAEMDKAKERFLRQLKDRKTKKVPAAKKKAKATIVVQAPIQAKFDTQSFLALEGARKASRDRSDHLLRDP